jgi:hypothetical protein
VLTRKGRIRKAAHHLAERVQSDKAQRTERLKSLLADRYGYTGGDLDQTLYNMVQSEMRLFQNIINGYLKDDQVLLQQLDVDVENLVLAYQMLKLPTGSAPPGPAPTGDGEEMQRLKDENERLSEELKVTMDTMGRMLNEYSSMFAGGGDTFEKDLVKPQTENTLPETDAADIDVGFSAPDLAADNGDIEIDIPDFSADETLSQGAATEQQAAMDQDEAAASDMDDEVSEIIDEVMGIVDEMNQEKTDTSNEAPPAPINESLMDDLEKVDIDIPDMDADALASTAAEPEPEPGSLEDEWAKLLEEEADAKAEKKEKE